MKTTHPRPIRLLPPALRNQIAAGEVVERPASVLKELLENCLDAGADDITVTLEDGGQSLLAVRDNGHGIPASDLELAVTRHATSKVANFQDLLTVASYGFRGEALPSIASVSELKLESAYCPEDAPCEEGAFLQTRHGEIEKSGPSSIQKGTLVTVSNLFTNVPARLKFLKAPGTELKRCQEVLLRLALARQDVGFSLNVGKNAGNESKQREVFRLHAGLSLHERLVRLWPPQATEGLVAFSGERGGLRAHGLASLPQASQTKGDRMLLYVNNRPVNDRLLLRAVREAYKGRLTSREYPLIVLFLEIDPQEIDVNVHPAKTEVRFRDERMVFGSVMRILEAGLSGHSHSFPGDADSFSERGMRPPFGEAGETCDLPLKQAELPPLYAGKDTPTPLRGGMQRREKRPEGFWGSLDAPRLVDWPALKGREEQISDLLDEEENPPVSDNAGKHDETGNPFISGSQFRDYRPSRVAEPSFPFAPQTPASSAEANALPLHSPAVTRATTREAALGPEPEQSHGNGNGYPIAVGPLVCLGQIANSYLVLRDNNDLLLLDQHAAHERVLLHTIEEETSGAQTQLLAIPVELPLHPAESERLMETLPALSAIGFDLATEQGKLLARGVPPLLGRSRGVAMLRDILMDRTEGIDDMFHLMACHSAIRAGDALTADEAAGLLRRWLSTPDRDFCPHGRPIVLRFGKNELEKLFKRKIG